MSGHDLSSLITVSEAIRILDATPLNPRVVRVPLSQADGLPLAQDILADRDYPPFDRSLMDGYAVRSQDVCADRASLRCIGEIAAGADPGPGIMPGETMAIMTGAPLPPGADAVIPVEGRLQMRDDIVELRGPAKPDKFIAARGSECGAGNVVLRRGTKLGPSQLAVAATVGAAEVDVFAQPRAAVLSTGNEIVPFDQPPGTTQIRNSNSIMLSALLRRLGCRVNDLGIVRDDPQLVRHAIERALAEHELLFITGGMSMGEYDFVPKVLIDLGVELKITKLRIKPGKPFIFGIAPADKAADGIGGFVFGLPGNPLSGFACTIRLCARLIARLAGSGPLERWTRAKLETDLERNGPREFYQPSFLSDGSVLPLQWKGSADVFALANANCLLVREENDPARAAGSDVQVLEIPV